MTKQTVTKDIIKKQKSRATPQRTTLSYLDLKLSRDQQIKVLSTLLKIEFNSLLPRQFRTRDRRQVWARQSNIHDLKSIPQNSSLALHSIGSGKDLIDFLGNLPKDQGLDKNGSIHSSAIKKAYNYYKTTKPHHPKIQSAPDPYQIPFNREAQILKSLGKASNELERYVQTEYDVNE